jgi:uncharacterized protein YxeA
MREKKQQTHAFDLVFELFVKQSFITSFSISNKDASDHIHMYIVIESRASFLNEREKTTHTRNYSISRFSSEWKRRDNTHAIRFEMRNWSYLTNKILSHRFQSWTKTQTITLTCALLFDLALFFWIKEKNNTHTILIWDEKLKLFFA